MMVSRGVGKVFNLTTGIGPEHPAKVDMFGDLGSVGHVFMGVISGILPVPFDSALMMGFLGYQLSQEASGETWSRTGGEFIEFALGMVLGAVVKPLMMGGARGR